MSLKNILVVVESIDVDDSSGSKANVAIICNLINVGYEVLVMHYTRKDIQIVGARCIAITERKFNATYFLSRFQRKLQHWFDLNLAKHLEPLFGFSFTFFNDVSSIKAAVSSIEDFKPDLVLTLSKGASFRPHYSLLKIPELHHKWMAYIHDPYPFHYYPEPYQWSEPGYEQKIKFFEALAKKCKWVAFPSLYLKEFMEDKYPSFKNKGIIIPHQINSEKSRLSKESSDLVQENKFTVLHAGNLMKQRPPFYLIKAFQQFLDKVPEAVEDSRLLLVGNSSYHQNELELLDQKTPNLRVVDYIEYEVMQSLQKEVSVNIILESKATLSPFLPGKFPHCITAKKQILLLGPATSESRRLLGEDYQFWAEIDDVNRIAGLLENLYKIWRNDPDDLNMERADLIEYLSERFLKKQLNQILS